MVGTLAAANHPFGWARAYFYSSTSSPSLCCCNYKAAAAARVRVRPPSQYQSHSQIGYQKSLLVSKLGALRLPSSSWSGLKHLPHITTPSHSHQEKKKKRKKGKVRGTGKGVYASLFGVGAPEVLVIGVVALLVFGPKGLAEVARNLGKTLRAFQPTIRELQDVSREFKSTLEKEIGLDDIASSTNNTYKPTSFPNENQQPMVDPNGTPKSEAYTSEDLLKVTQEQLATSAAAATGPQPEGSSPQEHDIVADAPSKVSAPTAPESASQIQSSEKAEKER